MRASARSAGRQPSYPERVTIVVLEPGQKPPADERYLLFEWQETGGLAIMRDGDALRYRVGPDRWRFWRIEAPLLATRLGLNKVYFTGEAD